MDMPVFPGAMVSKSDNFLIEKSYEGLKKKGLVDEEYQERLNEELNTIIECGLSDFMLNTAYTVLLCKSKGIIVGPGRGSVGGSLVAPVQCHVPHSIVHQALYLIFIHGHD